MAVRVSRARLEGRGEGRVGSSDDGHAGVEGKVGGSHGDCVDVEGRVGAAGGGDDGTGVVGTAGPVGRYDGCASRAKSEQAAVTGTEGAGSGDECVCEDGWVRAGGSDDDCVGARSSSNDRSGIEGGTGAGGNGDGGASVEGRDKAGGSDEGCACA